MVAINLPSPDANANGGWQPITRGRAAAPRLAEASMDLRRPNMADNSPGDAGDEQDGDITAACTAANAETTLR